MATVVLNGVLVSTDPSASVDGSSAADLIQATGGLSGARIRGLNGDDVLEFANADFSLFNGNAGSDLILAGSPGAGITQSSIFGGIGEDVITLDADSSFTGSLIRGDDGADQITVFFGAALATTRINGNAGADIILVDSAAVSMSSVFGGIGDDVIDSFSASFTDALIRGDEGADFIGLGGSYQNTLVNGNAGNDLLDADASTVTGGTLTVRGGIGDDTLNLLNISGGAAIFGDDGRDRIISGQGSDTISGGEGADTFQYFSADQSSLTGGIDRITDFVVGTDVIDFSAAIPTTQILSGGEAAALDQASINAVLPLFGASGNAGTFSFQGSTFLVLNGSDAGYQAGTDILIDITGISGNIGAIAIV